MLLKRILIALPVVASAVTMIALGAHADRVALSADLAGLVVALLATLGGIADAIELPAFTVARAASLRHAAFSVIGLIFFAATATVIRDGAAGALALGAMSFAAMVIAGAYGRVVLLAFECGHTSVHYPGRAQRIG